MSHDAAAPTPGGSPAPPAVTPTVELTVDPAGNVIVSTAGFYGPSCRDASRFLERALGDAVAERTTAEFHLPQPSAARLHARG